MANALNQAIKKNDVILLKASRGIQMDSIIPFLHKVITKLTEHDSSTKGAVLPTATASFFYFANGQDSGVIAGGG
ncbi:hypothetical protein [Paenibacillus lautus]|uniref:hypothetical protein n=1 Tax=Paenibacillus lautus TaxID=1401 RepID=UPI002DBCC3BC|nr:hypothetical protein [Paenibacillus lautus]MEC0260226.1 hypothetical protein [Paenibacillus lautus]